MSDGMLWRTVQERLPIDARVFLGHDAGHHEGREEGTPRGAIGVEQAEGAALHVDVEGEREACEGEKRERGGGRER